MNHLKNKYLLFYALVFSTLCLFECKKKATPLTSIETGTVKDTQGNTYNTVKIGNQWWMAENLKVKVYNDSTAIVEVKSTDADSLWANKTIGAFCNVDTRYGLYYNWYAINTSKKIAPVGWHVATDDDWKILEMELGIPGTEADQTSWRGTTAVEKLLPQASVGWPTTYLVFGTNESGFSALPGGCKVFNGEVGDLASTGYWWSSSNRDPQNAWYRNLSCTNNAVFRYYANKRYGFSVRCVKDQPN